MPQALQSSVVRLRHRAKSHSGHCWCEERASCETLGGLWEETTCGEATTTSAAGGAVPWKWFFGGSNEWKEGET